LICIGFASCCLLALSIADSSKIPGAQAEEIYGSDATQS